MKRPSTPGPQAAVVSDPALSTAEAAQYLGGMHVKTLCKLARRGEIESIQLLAGGTLKFRLSALNAFLARNVKRVPSR